jgi:hypothetical protein
MPDDDPSAPLHLTLRQADELEPVEDDELTDYLVELAPEIGWIIIHFNSLEDHVSGFIREAILRDAFQDERMDVFLAGMLFSAKARALLDLYGQMIEYGGSAVTHEDLRKVDFLLTECATRRNEYAHADWIGTRDTTWRECRRTWTSSARRVTPCMSSTSASGTNFAQQETCRSSNADLRPAAN